MTPNAQPPACPHIAILQDRFKIKNNIQKSSLAPKAFRFRGDKYIMQKVRVVSLAQNMPTSPYLCLYQILSKYFKPLRSGEVHKNLASKFVQGRQLGQSR